SVSKLSGMTAMDAITLTRQGGRCSCREITGGWTIGSDYDRFLAVDLYNSEDFFALYEDANCFKRVASWSLSDMAKASFKLDTPTQIDVSVVAGTRTRHYQLKNMSADFVHALALWTQGNTSYTDLDLEADSGRLDRRALLEGWDWWAGSGADTKLGSQITAACEGISYDSAVLEEGDAGAASSSLEAFVPANEVPPVVEKGGEGAGRRRPL
ncbi:hypothetical protein FOZ63_008342, partial [Perkinsus olseni]